MLYRGKISFFTRYLNKYGLIEGATESFASRKYGVPNTSTYHSLDSSNNSQKNVLYNLPEDCGYPEQVALIRQMEYALGMESIKSILLGNNDFFNEFSKEYGKDTFRAIRHRANRLLYKEMLKDPAAYFQETQNLLLERVFNKDFSTIQTIDDAKRFFERLQSFETLRGKIEGDTYYTEYYEDKLSRAKAFLLEKGYSKEEIDSFSEEHKYRKQEYFPNKELHLGRFLTDTYLNYPDFREAFKSNPKSIQVMKVKKDDFSTYFLITVDGNPMFLRNSTGMNYQVCKIYPETGQITNTRTGRSSDTFVQREGHYYIKTKDGNELSFEDIGFTEKSQNVENLIEIGEKKLQEREQGKQKHLEAQTQTESLKRLSFKQRFSSLSRAADAIKGIFNRGNTIEKHTDKDTSQDIDDGGTLNDR